MKQFSDQHYHENKANLKDSTLRISQKQLKFNVFSLHTPFHPAPSESGHPIMRTVPLSY